MCQAEKCTGRCETFLRGAADVTPVSFWWGSAKTISTFTAEILECSMFRSRGTLSAYSGSLFIAGSCVQVVCPHRWCADWRGLDCMALDGAAFDGAISCAGSSGKFRNI